jgi:hypothetical protein
MKKLFYIAILITLTACGGKTLSGYDALLARDAVKRVDFSCDYDKIAQGQFARFGDYCRTAGTSDYVSYYVPADIQATKGFTGYLAQTAAGIRNSNHPGSLKYFQEYAGSYEVLLQYQLKNSLPTSFVALYDDNLFVSLSAADLLLRQTIYPSLNINTFEGNTLTYRIGPKGFEVPFRDVETGRLMGLPDYGGLNADAYTAELNKYRASMGAYPEYSADRLNPLDYAIPQAGAEKARAGQGGAAGKVTPPQSGEDLLHNYLPSYVLERVDIVLITPAGTEKVAVSYSSDDILRVLVSTEENPALFYSGKIAEGDRLALRFSHLAQKPAADGLKEQKAKSLGIDQIYGEMQKRVDTWLYVDKFFDLKKLNAACGSPDKLESLKEYGISALPSTGCSSVSAEIIKQFNKIEEVLKK